MDAVCTDKNKATKVESVSALQIFRRLSAWIARTAILLQPVEVNLGAFFGEACLHALFGPEQKSIRFKAVFELCFLVCAIRGTSPRN